MASSIFRDSRSRHEWNPQRYMKKLSTIFFLIILLTGCAGRRGPQKTCLSNHDKFQQVGQITSRLAYSNGLDSSKIYICIIEDTAINAWIDKRPQIYLTTSFLDAIPDSDALMCVLAHELSHYTLNHISNTQAISLGVSAVFQVANIFLPGVGYLNYLANPTITHAYGRANELDADENAVEMCRNAGMMNARQQMINMLSWLKADHKEKDQFYLWATHPPLNDRIKHLSEQEERKPQNIKNGASSIEDQGHKRFEAECMIAKPNHQ